MKDKIYSIEALRFIFICVICLIHCPALGAFIYRGYLAVEFFFILSGFLLYKSYIRHLEVGTLDYTLSRVKRFIVPYFITILLLLLLDRKRYLILDDFSAEGIISKYYVRIPELLFMQNMGISNVEKVNGPTWFISVMIIAGALLYALLRNYGHRAIAVLIPLICLFGLSYTLGTGGCDFKKNFELHGLPNDVIMGASEMGIGIICSYIMEWKKNVLMNNLLFNVISLLCFIGFCCLLFCKSNYDYLAVFLVPFFVCNCFCPKSIMQILFSYSIWAKLGGLSMFMYIIHIFFSNLYYIFCSQLSQIPYIIMIIAYILIIVVSASVLKSLSAKIYRYVFE